MPYSYGFEDNNLATDGWTTQSIAGNTGINTEAKKTGSYGFQFYYNYNPPQYLISPELTGTENGVEVTFQYKNGSSFTETFTVGYSTTTGSVDQFTWDSPEYTAPTSWTEYQNTFPAGTKYVAIKYTANDQFKMYIDDISFMAPPSCPKPTLSSMVATTNNSATITWTPSGVNQTLFDIYWSTTNTAPTSVTTPGAANQSGTSYTISGLTASTDYYVWIRGNCGTEGSPDISGGWTSAVSFKTKCNPTDLPYSTNFDAMTTGNVPDCWTVVAGNCSVSNYGTAHSSSNHARLCNAANIVVSPAPISVEANTTQVEFYAKMIYTSYSSSYYYNGNLEVGYLTNSADASTFVAVRTLNYGSEYASYPATAIKVPMTSVPNGAVIAFRCQPSNSSTSYGWYIDDVTIDVAPSCVAVTPGATTDITSTGATLHWTTTNAATTTYTITDGDAIDVTTAAGATSHPLTGLTSGTTYSTLTITANCGGSDHSDPVNVPSFTTAYGVPFAESFGTTSLPSNWAMYTGQYNESTHTATLVSGSPWNFNTGNGVFDNHAKANIYSTGCYKWLVTPGIVMEDNVQITFDLALTKFSGSNQQVAQDNQADDKFIVLVTTDNGETWTVLRKWDNAGSSYVYNSIAYSATGQTEAIDLSAYAGQTVKIAFYGESTVSNGDNNLHIDNVNIDYIPNCAKPTGLAKSNVAAHQVDLSWTKGDAETDWDICINDNEGALVSIDENDVTITGSSVSYTLTGLDPETAYTVKVRANCGGGNGVSQWSNVVSFTTTVACPAPTSPSVLNSSITAHTAKFTWIGSNATPDYVVSYRTAAYTEGFEENFNTSSIPTGWTRYSGLVDNVVAGTETLTTVSGYWNTNSYALGSYNASLNIYGSSCKYWLVSPEINIESGYSFSFDLALTGYSSSSAASGTCADDRFVVLIYADDAWTILREWNNSGSTYVYNDIATDGEPVNDIDISGYVGKTVKFAFYGESTASGGDNDLHIDNVAVGIAHDAGTWQTVDVDDSGDDTPAAEKTLTGLVAEKKYEAKVKANCTASSDGYSDETSIVSFTTLAGNQKPTDVEVDPVTLSSSTATVSWTGNGCSDHHVSYDVYYATSDVAEVPATPAAPNLITGVTETSKTITGLDAETEYKVWVRDNCGTDGVSEWTAAVTFTTLAACPQPTAVAVSNIGTHVADVEWTGIPEYTVKYRKSAYVDGIEETFGTSLPSGWENKTGLLSAVMGGTALSSSTTQWNFGTNNGVFDNHARINIYGTSRYGWLITPTFTLPVGATMSFDLALTAYSGTLGAPATTGTDDRFVVLVYADDAWHILREWNNSGSTYVYNDIPCAATGETVDDIDISAYEGKTVKFAFYGESTQSNADNNLHIDNVIIGTPVPAGTWSTIEDVDANSTTLTGLDAGTKYDVVIEPECNTTLASDPVSFTTLALPTFNVKANNWYALSSPMHDAGQTYESVANVENLTTGTYDFLRYDEPTSTWKSQKSGGFSTLEPGRGYIYRRANDAVLKVDGEPNTGNVNVNITMDADGWNLIGNPFMVPIRLNSTYMAPSSTAVLTSSGYKLSTNGMWTVITSSTDIAVGQAVLVKATTDGTLTLRPSASKSVSAAEEESNKGIVFSVSNDVFTDVAIVRFSSEEGLPKIGHLNPEAPMLSIDGYAIANLNEGTESFPMSFSGNGEYTLTVSGNTNVTGYLHLVDRATGRDIDLLSTPSYSFTGSPVSDRFTVKLTPDANEGSSTSRFAIFDGNSLIVNGEGTLEVYDVMGRRLMSAEVTGSEYRIPGSDLHTGVYVLRMNGNSQKIVIK